VEFSKLIPGRSLWQGTPDVAWPRRDRRFRPRADVDSGSTPEQNPYAKLMSASTKPKVDFVWPYVPPKQKVGLSTTWVEVHCYVPAEEEKDVVTAIRAAAPAATQVERREVQRLSSGIFLALGTAWESVR
jgi:hypothetical protein